MMPLIILALLHQCNLQAATQRDSVWSIMTADAENGVLSPGASV